jgi:hypothetical protein
MNPALDGTRPGPLLSTGSSLAGVDKAAMLRPDSVLVDVRKGIVNLAASETEFGNNLAWEQVVWTSQRTAPKSGPGKREVPI